MRIDIREPSDYSAMEAQWATYTASQEMGRARERDASMAYRDIVFEKRDGMARIECNWPETLRSFREYEALATTIGTQTADHKEGAHASVEKRAPQCKGHSCYRSSVSRHPSMLWFLFLARNR
jgi:hypothetical protein